MKVPKMWKYIKTITWKYIKTTTNSGRAGRDLVSLCKADTGRDQEESSSTERLFRF